MREPPSENERKPRLRVFPVVGRALRLAALLTIGAEVYAWADRAEAVIAHLYAVGKTERVKKLAKTYQDPHLESREPLRSVHRIEVKTPPPPCGMKVSRHFSDEVAKKFRVPLLDKCELKDRQVHCDTEYLSRYPRSFLRLAYEYETDLYIKVEAHRSTNTGEETKAKFSKEDAIWLQKLFFDIVEVAACRS